MRAALQVAALLFAACHPPAARAAPEALLIDTEASRAGFSLRALLIKRVEGDFARVEGVIERDPAAGRFTVDVRISAQSVRMARVDHADWARSPDFFDALRHPWIAFRAERQPERLLHEGGTLVGELTLRGVTRPVQFDVAPAECPRPGIDCSVRARGEVQRGEFGMDARRVFLSDRVRLDFAIRVHGGETS